MHVLGIYEFTNLSSVETRAPFDPDLTFTWDIRFSLLPLSSNGYVLSFVHVVSQRAIDRIENNYTN